MNRVQPQRTLAVVQGVYFIVTGLWPLVHMRSFVSTIYRGDAAADAALLAVWATTR